MRKIYLSVFLALMLTFALMPTVQAQSPQQTLNQYISDLQKNPNDNALREKIIKHVQTIKPAPAIPEEVQKYMDRGIAAIESAKTAEDFQDAAAEFMKAVTTAPWLGNGYRNLAIAQDKAGQYDAALKNLQLYLLTRPSSSDEAWAKKLMNKVEYRKEKAAKESSPAAIAEKKQNEYEQWLKKLNGARYTLSTSTAQSIIDIKGTTLVLGFKCTWDCKRLGNGNYVETNRYEIHGREANYSMIGPVGQKVEVTFTISEDGDSITHRSRDFGNGSVTTQIYHRER